MKRKTLLTLCLLAAATMGTWAQGPNNSGTYYRNADGKSGAALKTAMHTIISKKTKSPSYDDLLELYKKTDTRNFRWVPVFIYARDEIKIVVARHF